MKTATDDDYRDWAASLGEIEDRISIEQNAKRDFYADIRATHGRIAADAIKSAMRILRLADDKREQREQIDAETAHIVQVLKSSDAGAPQEGKLGPVVEDVDTVDAKPIVEKLQVSAKETPKPATVSGQKIEPLPKLEIEELVLNSAESYPEEQIEEIVEAA